MHGIERIGGDKLVIQNLGFSYSDELAIYDGLDIEGSVSTAEVAKTLQSPVILIIDCTKITRTVAALVLGCQKLDPEVLAEIDIGHPGNIHFFKDNLRALEKSGNNPDLV